MDIYIYIIFIWDKIVDTLRFLSLGDHHIVWRKGHEVLSAGNILISRDPRFKLHENDYRLELQNIRPNDAGDFVCQLAVLGEAMEVAHTVEVLGTSAKNLGYL